MPLRRLIETVERGVTVEAKGLAIRGVAVTWLGRACGLVVTFFVTPVLVRGLGDATYGVWSMVMTLTGYYGLVDLGFGKATTKYMAQFDASRDQKSVRQVLATSLATYALLSGIVVIAATVTAIGFPWLFGTGGQGQLVLFWVLILTGLKVSVQLLGTVFQSALIARNRLDIANALAIAAQIAVAVVMVLIVGHGGGLIHMAIGVLGVGTVAQSVVYYCAKRYADVPRWSWSDIDRGVWRSLFRFGSLTVVTQFARRVGTYSGTIIIGASIGFASVAYYSVAEALTQKCVILGKAINQVAMPMASRFDVSGNRSGLAELAVLGSRVLLAMGLCFVSVLLVLGDAFICFWISPEFAARSYPIFCVLALACLVELPGRGLHAVLEGMGRVAFLSRLSAVQGATTVVLGVILVNVFGGIGMAWAVFVAVLITDGVALPVHACRSLEYSVGRYARRVVVPASVAAIPGFGVAHLVDTLLPAASLLEVVSQMGLVAAVAAVSAFFICLDHATRMEVVRVGLPFLRRTNEAADERSAEGT